MSKAICTGGMGKNPAIEKINQLNETSSRMQAAAVLERRAFAEERERGEGSTVRRSKQIVDKFGICFERGESE